MVDFIDILIDDFLSPTIFALLGIVLFNLYRLIKRRFNELRRVLKLNIWETSLFPPKREKNSIWITYALIPPSELDISHYTIEEGDARSLFTLISFLSEAYNRKIISVKNHDDIRSELEHIQNIVSLSGPLYNKVTEHYIGRCGSPVRFQQEDGIDYLIADDSQDGEIEKLETIKDEDGRPRKCHGIILCANVKMGNKYQRVLILAGISTLSTYGSILVLQSIYEDTEFQNEVGQFDLESESKWLIVFSIDSWGTSIPWYDQTAPFKRSDLEVNIEKVYTEDEFREPYKYSIEE